ncbi:HNH endonuclease family protein [Helicobacter pylori]
MYSAKLNKYGDFERLKKLLVSYLYQNLIALKTANTIKQTCFNILQAIKENKPISEVKTLMVENLRKNDVTRQYKNALKEEETFGKKWAKPVLFLLEYLSNDNTAYLRNESVVEVEHVLPKTPQENSHWLSDFNEDQRKNATNSLANLTLLRKTKNIQASNDDFESKKKVYKFKDDKATCFTITRNIADLKKWDYEAFLKRQKEIISKIEKVFDIE